ncbi:hypothetical protein OBBRIDRAFT_696197, partial [Obba rivulosa]
KSSVFDAEMLALCMGISLTLSQEMDGVKELHVYVDNKGAGRAILDPSVHSAQMCSILACARVREFLRRSNTHHVHIHWCPSHVGIVPNEFVDGEAKEALREDAPHDVSISAARSDIIERMRGAWRAQAEQVTYRGRHLALPSKYWRNPSHTLRGNPFLARMGGDARLFARFTRVVTGHAPVGDFRERFHLDGPVDCLCGHAVESIQHILWQCPVWIRKWRPQSRMLEELERLDPFADVLWFLRMNPLAATFEFADYQAKAQDEIDRG